MGLLKFKKNFRIGEKGDSKGGMVTGATRAGPSVSETEDIVRSSPHKHL